MEPNSPKKIQFAVPLFQSQLDPQAAEHIRKRRPTPATLVIYNDPGASGEEKPTAESQTEAQRKQTVYTPPTMRELQLVVEQHFQRQEQRGVSDSSVRPELQPGSSAAAGESADPSGRGQPEERATPHPHLPRRLDALTEEAGETPPFRPGPKLVKKVTDSSCFHEEEEDISEQLDHQFE